MTIVSIYFYTVIILGRTYSQELDSQGEEFTAESQLPAFLVLDAASYPGIPWVRLSLSWHYHCVPPPPSATLALAYIKHLII